MSSIDVLNSDIEQEKRFNESLARKKERRHSREVVDRIKQASQKAAAHDKSPIQLEYEQEQQEQEKRASSIALERLQAEQQKKVQNYYAHTKPSSEINDSIREDLHIDTQPTTRHLEAFSLGNFNPDTKEFSDITYYTLEIQEQAPLEVKNSHVKHPGEGKVLVASMKPKPGVGDQKEKMINIQKGIPKFGGGTQKEKIILPVKLVRKKYKDKTLSGTQVNDLLLKGYKEIDRGAPEITAIVSAHDMDTRLIHGIKEVQQPKAVIDSAKIGKEEPRQIEEFAVGKACNIPSCSICFSESEVGTIPDYASQQSVFL